MKLEVVCQEPNGDAQNCHGASISTSRLFFSMSGCTLARMPTLSMPSGYIVRPCRWFVDGRTGSFMPDTKLATGFSKFTGGVAGPIIRKNPFDPHAAHRIPGNGMPEELHGRFRRLVRVDRRVDHTRRVINANMPIFPAGAAAIHLSCAPFRYPTPSILPGCLMSRGNICPSFLISNDVPEALLPKRQVLNNQVCVRPERQNSGSVPAGSLSHPRSTV